MEGASTGGSGAAARIENQTLAPSSSAKLGSAIASNLLGVCEPQACEGGADPSGSSKCASAGGQQVEEDIGDSLTCHFIIQKNMTHFPSVVVVEQSN